MTAKLLALYRQVWLLDFEFHQPPGERPNPLCMVARELRSSTTLRLWRDDLRKHQAGPFDVGREVLFVAFFASAELGCFLELGWPLPERVLDLFCEFRCGTNGLTVPCGNGLLGALAWFGLPALAATEKRQLQDLGQRGGPYTTEEKTALLEYCEVDVLALSRLLEKMVDKIDIPRALLRGRYMAAAARMERTGTPIDMAMLHRLRANWGVLKRRLVASVDSKFDVYQGETFKHDRFAEWLSRNSISWPHLPSGQLALDDDTFRQMVRVHPAVAPLGELRRTLGGMRLERLAVGGDGRNRCMLSPFRSKTSRNQPSNAEFCFGPSCWLRGLISPPRGRAISYIDWSQQEFGIAAALSGDEAMKTAYESADPYLTFAKQAGAVPPDAIKASHPTEREQYKVCALAVLYRMGSQSLGILLRQPEAFARQLLQHHRAAYPRFWQWSDGAVNHAMLWGWLETVYGWRIHVVGQVPNGRGPNPRSLANFPVQANGAEMLRLACCLATESGVDVCAPIHDALLVEAPAGSINQVAAQTQAAMAQASRRVLDSFELRSVVKTVVYPDRYMDKRGIVMWRAVMELLDEVELPRRDVGSTLGVKE